jgi:AmmeMemoRadiSam system protein A
MNSGLEAQAHTADQQVLLALARRAIGRAALGQPLEAETLDAPSSWLQAQRASFVTLTTQGALRGCIGGLYPTVPLVEDVQLHAYAAAREDPRFPPLRPDEVSRVRIEISVLSAPEPLAYGNADELLLRLRPGVDGVIVQSGWHRATFLPQVWEKVPAPEIFLAMLCEKASLAADAWRSGKIEVMTYQVEMFEEHAPPEHPAGE